ncbi:MAG: HsdR family type I site-specific deoxyribonuclease [Candidatus Omnitrophica bacterium]|nr:HsdR family type I site-specific deoxyribonuclease [Candidatus Omnitrophota bacterium]
MAVGSEKSAVQNPLIRYATEAGWTYLSPEEILDRRRGVTSPVLDSVLIQQLQRLNPGVVDLQRTEELVRQITRVRPNIEGNFDAWAYLKGIKTVFVADEKRERNLTLLDLDDLSRNAFHVTDEFTFSNGTPPDIRTDVTFFINGIPVIVVETKSATKLEGIAEAFDDIRYYHERGPEFMALAQLHALTHLVQFFYGATWALSRKELFNWREEQAGDFETLVKTFVAPRRILRVIADYILFVRRDDQLTKAVLRPHQMRAAERCIARARDSKKRRGLVWHTQGSGKTYTMISVAKLLMADSALDNPTVLMLIDRNELEAQLSGVLESVGVSNAVVVRNKRHLRQLLASDRRGLIVSMIHKFDDIPANANTRANVFVLVDEAHRTTGGDLGNYLMGALPNATYLGFTGTPIDKTAYGKGTFKVFGIEDERGYLDKYSIRESVADGTTVPLNYALAPNDLQVDRETLEREFLGLAELEGVSDIEELNKVLEKAVTLRNMLKNPERVQKVAHFVARHFLDTIEPMGYKAFLVAVDREACALYKAALDRFLPPEYSQVVISGGGKKDLAYLRPFHLSEEREDTVRKAFRKPGQQPKILIVTEKLLTGFDAPILYCMYLDKPMRDHVLLQAIARVNRPYEDEDGRRKPAGFVLDFVGIFDKLERALAFDSDDVRGVVEGVEVLRKRFEALILQGRRDYLSIAPDQTGDKRAEAILEQFRDQDRRQKFYAFFQEVQEVYEILSPDAFLRPYLPDIEELARMFYLVRASYERGISVDKSFLRKTAKLVQEQTYFGEIKPPTPVYALDEQTLEKIAGGDKPDTVKVFNLLKALYEHIKRLAHEQPWLISIGDRAELIAQAFEERQKTTQEALAELEALIKELREAEQQRNRTDLSPEAFAVLWYLKKEGLSDSDGVARAVDVAFVTYPHWRSSSPQERELRKALYKALIDSGVDDVVDLATGVLRMLRRASA